MTDIESGLLWSSDSPIGSTSVRAKFVQKVYSLLAVQLLATVAIAAPFVMGDPFTVQQFIATNLWFLYLSMAVTMGVMIAFACAPDLMRRYPTNYILLALFTAAEGVSVGIVSSMYTTSSVLVCLSLVLVVVVVLSAVAANTKIDLTRSLWPYLLAATVVMMAAGLLLMFFPSQTGTTIYAAMGALLFSVYLVFDTQMILGGKREMQYSVDDYVPATIALYVDIISLFIYLLQLFGDRRD